MHILANIKKVMKMYRFVSHR